MVVGGTLRMIRPDGSGESVPVAGGDMAWFENPDRTEAVAFPLGAGEHDLLRFRHDGNGWHLVADRTPRGRAWGACVAGSGQVIALVGEEPALVLDDMRRVPIRTDLRSVGECAFGTASGVVVQRSVDQDQRHRTSVRGVDLHGGQTWSRDLDGAASGDLVTISPSGQVRWSAAGQHAFGGSRK